MTATQIFDPSDPAWLAHRYDAATDRLVYRHVPRDRYADGPFLTDELIGSQPESLLARSDGVEAARAGAGAVHFLFHSAFCASTMAVQALDLPGLCMGLSEPVLLNDITGIRRRGERQGADLARLLDEALSLLSRRWDDDRAVIIKPSNILTALMTPALALRPDARALLLYAPLPTFLASVARKGLWCRLWARELLEGLLRDGLVDLGFEAKDYFRLGDLQVAAVGWLVQHRQFAALTEHFPDRVRTLDSGRLLADPATLLAQFLDFAKVAEPQDAYNRLAAHPALTRHSKTGANFSPDARGAEQVAARAAHGDEIDKVHEWARAVAVKAGISMTLPLPLTG
ncbi:MAG: hypothetical protein DI569_02425 [Sphingopyxis macrogoltabida]|uniref:Uncharacterized protein n=1 Tax=Sphingopyxis macrogoltabida TaxID=33050 RepID=A0A2W5L4M1_SPHMC|nr:MAG: hypothetical protein DI569_02425 [Sphingopyxis macrogoltabida]